MWKKFTSFCQVLKAMHTKENEFIFCPIVHIVSALLKTKHTGSLLLIYAVIGWWRGSVVERRSLAGELSLSCARPAADG